MTKGRRPKNALGEAVEIAERRGSVERIAAQRYNAFDFIINEPDRVVYVKVKRSQTLFTYEFEILHKYQRELASLHRVALTLVTAREFWVRAPNGDWQFFLVRHDSIREVRADGMVIPREVLPVRTVDLRDEPAGGGSPGDGE
ncbi:MULTISPECIES: hypothetical protein [Methanoregula]|jgi:hypothetical protein|uniref:Archaeal holliday junction resolvase (Hjc) n=1 Tax=Methanoregula formicica (strain DSM 22288 / NBRC 105244 / SMSP) TaxID=593750 RepID=L0HHQ9_METFS|nr:MULTISPECIES: hypothetical protein [Methanoregula]AGB03301.1 hypothetical protein Metfor_2297 [Methanoregula formicica SMSP]MDD5144242.1 hypothetical protein [Methanoregula sp.]